MQLEFRYAPAVSEITVVTPDRALLFANMTGALAAWGMNIVTADAFSNRQGVVVDSFRFTDSFRTLEMNASEHEAFVKSVHDVMTGASCPRGEAAERAAAGAAQGSEGGGGDEGWISTMRLRRTARCCRCGAGYSRAAAGAESDAGGAWAATSRWRWSIPRARRRSTCFT